MYGLPDFEANTPGFDNDGKSGGDHAGKVETSLMMALDPSCSDMTRLPNRDESGHFWAMGKNAYNSNRRKYLGQKVKSLLEECDRIKPEHRFRTFEDVENFWKKYYYTSHQQFSLFTILLLFNQDSSDVN